MRSHPNQIFFVIFFFFLFLRGEPNGNPGDDICSRNPNINRQTAPKDTSQGEESYSYACEFCGKGVASNYPVKEHLNPKH